MALVAALTGGGELSPSFTMPLPAGAFGMGGDLAHGLQNQNVPQLGCLSQAGKENGQSQAADAVIGKGQERGLGSCSA